MSFIETNEYIPTGFHLVIESNGVLSYPKSQRIWIVYRIRNLFGNNTLSRMPSIRHFSKEQATKTVKRWMLAG